MRKDVFISDVQLRMIVDERLRFLILDNTQLHVQRGDVLCMCVSEPFVDNEGSSTNSVFGKVTCVTNHGVAAGCAAVGFDLVSESSLMGLSMMSGATVAEEISRRRPANTITRERFSSDADFEEYKRLSQLMAENTSKKPTLQMNARYEEFKELRDQIPMREASEGEA